MITKLVEGNFITCMDEGSNPSDSTFLTSTFSWGFFIYGNLNRSSTLQLSVLEIFKANTVDGT